MMRKKVMSIITYIACLSVILTLLPVTAWAKDNPTGESLSEFPSVDDTLSGDTTMNDNGGRIDKVNSNGTIMNNLGSIGTFAGILDTNCSGATIEEVSNGIVYKNSGTINKTDNQGQIKTNLSDGRIIESGRPVENNWGTIDNQYSDTVSNNYGSIGTVSQGASVSAHYDGTIGENNGSVTVTGEHTGMPQITTNNGTITVKSGAKCTIVNNNSGGKVIVEAGGACEITGECSGEVEGNAKIKKDGKTYYKLNFKNADISEFTFEENVIQSGSGYFVLVNTGGSSSFTCSFDHSKYHVPWNSSEGNPVTIPIETDANEPSLYTRDDDGGGFTIHFHKYDTYTQLSEEEKAIFPDKHNCKCNDCEEEFTLESCSGGEATCVSKAMCAKCGAEYGNVNSDNHTDISDSWQNDSTYHWKRCNGCSAQVNKAGHMYGEWITDTEAKIGVAGTKHRVCSECNYQQNGTIPPLKKEDGPTNPDNPTGGGNSSSGNTEPENGGESGGQQTVIPMEKKLATNIKKSTLEDNNFESSDSKSDNETDNEIVDITYNPDGTEVRSPEKISKISPTGDDNGRADTPNDQKTSEQIGDSKKSHTRTIAVVASAIGVTCAALAIWFLKKRGL